MSKEDFRKELMKCHLNSLYGKVLNPAQKEAVKEAFNSGNTHAVYADTDSIVIDGSDKTLCMYDHAKELLKLW